MFHGSDEIGQENLWQEDCVMWESWMKTGFINFKVLKFSCHKSSYPKAQVIVVKVTS